MLEGLLHHKKEPKEYLCSLVISDEGIDSALWEAGKDGGATILSTSHADYTGEWEQAIDAADKAISEIEEKLPENVELQKVVFGLYPEWLSDDHIKETFLKQLKQLTTALSLTPVGFVELPIAITHLLAKEEGTQQTVILIGLKKKSVTVTLFKIGKLVGTKTVVRTPQICQDIEKILGSFTDVEVLPSRILLYGFPVDVEAVKTEMHSYPWQKKANFLHFPKIETLPADYPVKAVAVASATEITPHVEETPAVETLVAQKSEKPADEPAQEAVHTHESQEVEAIAQDLGFVAEKDLAEENGTNDAPRVTEPLEKEVVNVVEPVPLPSAKPAGKKFTLPKLSFTFKLPAFNKLGIGLLIGVAVILLGGAVWAFSWFAPSAKAAILVEPQLFDKVEEITIDTGSSASGSGERVLAGKIEKVEVTGSQTIPATGQKNVGEKAKGEITIFNKTLNSKTFKRGAKLSSGKLIFTLDTDVNIASASEGVGTLTYGTTKASLTAEAIGTASNVPSNTDFTFAELPSSSYTARNEKALAGGTSREVLVVTRDDQKAVREKVIEDLEKKAKVSFEEKLAASQKVLDGSLQTDVVKETYSKEIGEETSEVGIEATVEISAATYDQTAFDALVEKLITGQIASGFEYRKENTTISIEEIDHESTTIWRFKPRIKMKLLPKIDTTQYAKKIAGKSITAASEILKNEKDLAGVEFAINAPFGFMKKNLPSNPSQIKFTIESL